MNWHNIPVDKGYSNSSGTTSLGSMARRPQYKVEMRHSSGAEQMERMFLAKKSREEMVRSARRPVRKVRLARARPMIVRYWNCQP